MRLVTLAKSILVGVVLFYALLLALVYAMQRRMLFPAPAPRPPAIPGGTLVEIAAPSGPVYAIHLPAQPGRATVVHFHGNGEQLGDASQLAQSLGALGLGFYSIEYPGYGLAAKIPASERGIYQAAEAALEHLERVLGTPRQQTVLLGQSLGSGAAVEMARRGLGARLILISPYTSIADVAGRLFWYVPVRLLIRDPFDNAEKAPQIAMPVLIIHGDRDEVIPVDMGRSLGKIFPRATVEIVAGAHHNDILQREVVAAIARFAQG